MKLAPPGTSSRFGMTIIWGILWSLVTIGVTLTLMAAYLFLAAGGYGVIILFFGGAMVGMRFFAGAVCLFPLIVLITALASASGKDGRWTRALLGGAWGALALELGYRLAPPGDVEMLGNLLPVLIIAGLIGGWVADRPSLWPPPPRPEDKLSPSPMMGLRPISLLALGLVVAAFWADIVANPGPQLG
jgi:hypothetical protein